MTFLTRAFSPEGMGQLQYTGTSAAPRSYLDRGFPGLSRGIPGFRCLLASCSSLPVKRQTPLQTRT